MEKKARIRINLSLREIELEGSEDFIEKYSETINNYLETIKSPISPVIYLDKNFNNQSTGNKDVIVYHNAKSESIPDSFGEFYSKLPKSIKDVDKILAAGFFCQSKNENNSFSTQEASSLLIEQGVKLTNPAASLNQNLSTKKIFKHDGKYRVSESGIEYLRKLTLTID